MELLVRHGFVFLGPHACEGNALRTGPDLSCPGASYLRLARFVCELYDMRRNRANPSGYCSGADGRIR